MPEARSDSGTESKPRITGPVTKKRYACKKCQHIRDAETNHYGEIYPFCPKCRELTRYVCLEPLPEGWGRPEPWKLVKLGDVAEIVTGRM